MLIKPAKSSFRSFLHSQRSANQTRSANSSNNLPQYFAAQLLTAQLLTANETRKNKEKLQNMIVRFNKIKTVYELTRDNALPLLVINFDQFTGVTFKNMDKLKKHQDVQERI